MESFERPSQKPKEEAFPVELDDFVDRPQLYVALKRLPAAIRELHMPKVEPMDEMDGLMYLTTIIERREKANTQFKLSDESIAKEYRGREQTLQRELETTVLNDTENFIGDGQTADVKRFTYTDGDEERRLAVKYVSRPRAHTLDVDEEHDLLSEVEQLQRIEAIEKERGATRYIKVPHPYFYLRSGRVQCYGMEEVDGINLLKFRKGETDPQMLADMRESFRGIDRAALQAEITKFFEAMHTICYHGDIFIDRPGNIMASRDGTFYVIDFGEATRGSKIDEQLEDFYKEEKEKELEAAKIEIGKFLDRLYADEVVH